MKLFLLLLCIRAWAGMLAVQAADRLKGPSYPGLATILSKASVELETRCSRSKPVRLGVGQFLLSPRDRSTLFGAALREHLETALIKRRPAFDVITRSRLSEVQDELAFQKRLDEFRIQPIDGLVRGSYTVFPDRIAIFIEVVWIEDGTMLKVETQVSRNDPVAADLWEDPLHAPLDQEKIRVHVLTSSFSKSAIRDYPEWVRHLKSQGCEFAIWTTVERELGGGVNGVLPFELMIDPGDIGDPGLLKSLVDQAAEVERPNALISLNTKVFENQPLAEDPPQKKKPAPAKTYSVELNLRYFNLANKPWNRDPVIAVGFVQDVPNPIVAANKAARLAVADLVAQLRKRGLI